MRTIRDDRYVYSGCWVWCPGCVSLHMLPIKSQQLPPDSPGWNWNGSVEVPTFSPSLLVYRKVAGGRQTICHSFIRAGVWEYLSDCEHGLAGQRVPLPALPDWFLRD